MRRQQLTQPSTPQVVALAVVVAAVSLLFHHTLKADPRGWLHWGREIAGPGDFSTLGYPSWKPLPALLTTPLSLAGPAAPALWLVLMRVGTLVAFGLTFRLAARLGGMVAGVVAVVALALVPEWWPTVLGGQIEPTLLALGLLALERHFAGRPRQAILLGALVALGREEAWALLLLYAVWQAREDRTLVPLAAGTLLAVPVLWLGGDWLGSGSAVHGGVLAHRAPDAEAQRSFGSVPIYTLGLAFSLLAAPLWGALLAGIVAAGRSESWLVLVLGWAAVVWIGIDVVISTVGLPGEVRFMLPVGGLVSVVAGVGVSAIVAAVRSRWLRRPARGPARPLAPGELPPPGEDAWVPGRVSPPLPC